MNNRQIKKISLNQRLINKIFYFNDDLSEPSIFDEEINGHTYFIINWMNRYPSLNVRWTVNFSDIDEFDFHEEVFSPEDIKQQMVFLNLTQVRKILPKLELNHIGAKGILKLFRSRINDFAEEDE